MGCRLYAVSIDAHDPRRLAAFWSGVLDLGEPVEDGDGSYALLPRVDPGFRLRFAPSDAPKVVANRMHPDLTSTSSEGQQRTVQRVLDLGGRHIDVGQSPDDGHVVLADPEGNELCVIEAGNRFLADTADIGALSCDGTRQVGLFWSAALGWPLVWDQDEETAVQSPLGGSKVSWGGPPVEPKVGRNRLHPDLLPDIDRDVEVDRLVGLGARRLEDGHAHDGGVVLADPDGNELCVLPALRPPRG